MANNSPSPSDSNPAFDEAYNRFFQSLPENDRKLYSPCATADDLLDGLRKLDVLSKQRQKQRSTRFLSSIKKLNSRLRPYFDVVGICIQSNPQYTSLVWGALRLVLQVQLFELD